MLVGPYHVGELWALHSTNGNTWLHKVRFLYHPRLRTSARDQHDMVIAIPNANDSVSGSLFHWIGACNMKSKSYALQMHRVGNRLRNRGVSGLGFD